MLPGSRRRPQLRFCLLLMFGASCSALPDAAPLRHEDHMVEAEFLVPNSGRLVLPASTAEILVRELQLAPAPEREEFRGAERSFTYAPGTLVTVRGRVRIYAAGGNAPRPLPQVFAGARHLLRADAP